jgi:Bacterial regulatory helix-turn-helix protein, lysR family
MQDGDRAGRRGNVPGEACRGLTARCRSACDGPMLDRRGPPNGDNGSTRDASADAAADVPDLARRLGDRRIRWSDIETFLLVSDIGSFHRAVAPSGSALNTLRRRVERLETIIGRPLLARGVKGVVPTAAGRLVVEMGRAMDGARSAMLSGLS